MEIHAFRRAEWEPLPREGCRGVEGKVLRADASLLLALLRFSDDAPIDAHSAPHPIDRFCLEGRGNVVIGDETATIHAGEWVQWPTGVVHQVRTDGSTVLTLMVEHPSARSGEQR